MYFGELRIQRMSDQARLGTVNHLSEGFVAKRTHMSYNARPMIGPHGVSLRHDSLDAAVQWVMQNPYMLPEDTCPNTHGVNGPLLATWGNMKILGCVKAHQTLPVLGMGNPYAMGDSTLLAMNPDGHILGRITQAPKGWAIVVKGPETVVRVRRTTWAAAVALFQRTVLLHAATISRHEILDLLDRSPDFVRVATDFQVEREGLLALDTRPPPPCQGYRARLEKAPILSADLRLLGVVWQEDTAIAAIRHAGKTTREEQPHTSLDAAVNWILSCR